MKGKAKKCEMRDISGTIIIPISSLAPFLLPTQLAWLLQK